MRELSLFKLDCILLSLFVVFFNVCWVFVICFVDGCFLVDLCRVELVCLSFLVKLFNWLSCGCICLSCFNEFCSLLVFCRLLFVLVLWICFLRICLFFFVVLILVLSWCLIFFSWLVSCFCFFLFILLFSILLIRLCNLFEVFLRLLFLSVFVIFFVGLDFGLFKLVSCFCIVLVLLSCFM